MKDGEYGVNGPLVLLHVNLEQKNEPENANDHHALGGTQKLKHVRNNLCVVSKELILIHYFKSKTLL